MNRSKFLIYANYLYCIIILFLLFFVSGFSLGSKEQVDHVIETQPILFFLGRLLVDFVFVVLCLLIVLLLNVLAKWFLKENQFLIGKTVWIQGAACMFAAIAYILFFMLGRS